MATTVAKWLRQHDDENLRLTDEDKTVSYSIDYKGALDLFEEANFRNK